MNIRQRFKLSAGAGLVTMLLGVLMVVAPGAGAVDVVPPPAPVRVDGNPSCASLGYDVQAKYDQSGAPGGSGIATGGKTVSGTTYTLRVDWEWGAAGANISFEVVEPPSNLLVSAVIVKQTNAANIYSYDSPVSAGEGLASLKDDDFSHISFCADIPGVTPRGALSVDKVVDDVARPQADDLAFGFTVTCTGYDVGTDGTFTLTDLAAAKEITAIPAGTKCTVSETDHKGADKTEVAVGPGALAEGKSTEVTIVANASQDVTFENTYSAVIPRTGGISVKKALAGNDQASAADTSFGFTVDCTNGQTVVDLDPNSPATQARFALKASDVAKGFSGLPVGATCTVVEDVTGNADSTAITVDAVASSNNATVSGVTIDNGATRAVVVTNTFNTDIVIAPNPDPVIPPEPASLRIVKAVDAVEGGVVPSTWTVDFGVVGDGLDVSRTLDQGNTSDRFRDLDAGPLTITETTPTGDTSSLTEVECVEAGGGDVDVTEALSDKAATVVLDEGDDVTCTFTNTYPEVLSEGETPTEPPTEEPTPAVTPDVEVKGVQTVRALPRTGDESRGLAGMGALMLAVGAAMVLGSKRQLARR